MFPARPLSAGVAFLILAWLAQATVQGHEPPASIDPQGEHHRAEHHSANHDERHEAHHAEHHDEHHDEHHEVDHYHDVFQRHPDWYRSLSHHEWWHHHTEWHHRPWWAWWHHPAWSEVTTWFGGWHWSHAIDYNYAPHGTVVYRDGTVYLAGKSLGTAAEFTQSAQALAQVNVTDAAADHDNWLSLGTFAVTKEDAKEPPTHVVQLAVDKAGVISGILYDLSKKASISLHGSVDKETQRAAFTFNEKGNWVAEVGLSNLTQHEATLLVHEGETKHQLCRLTRLDSPPSAWQQSSATAMP